MHDSVDIAERVRAACIVAAQHAYEDAGFSGLCAEGRWECAIEAMRYFDIDGIVNTSNPAQPDEA